MMARILVLARWTFVEAVRERLLYVVLVFAAVLVVASCALTPLAPGAQRKVVVDLGLASLDALGVLVVLLVGCGLVRRDVERRTLDVLLTKPLSRLEYLAGKWAGLVATLAGLAAAETAVLAVALQAGGYGFHVAYLAAIGASLLGFLVVSAIAILFSTITGPALAAFFTLALVAGGHLVEPVERLASGTPIADLVRALGWIVPALGLFDVRGDVVYGRPLAGDALAAAAAYAGLFSVAALWAASLVFRRRDLR